MKKISLLTIILFMLTFVTVSAQSDEHALRAEQSPDGSVYTSVVKEQDFEQNDSNSVMSTYITEYDVTPTSATTTEFYFIKYLTSSWAKSTQYVWSESNTSSLTWSGNLTVDMKDIVKGQFGLSGSYTATYGVGVYIPADSTKWSKLAFGGDFNVRSVDVTKYTYPVYSNKNGPYTIIQNSNGTYKEPTSNTYLYVDYQ